MGKSILLVISVFVVMGTYYAMNMQQSLLGTQERVAGYQYEALARNAALTGFNRAKQALADEFVATSLSGDFEGAAYTTTVTISGTMAKVASVGSVAASGKSVDVTIEAEIEQHLILEIADEPPPFMQYGLLVEDDLTLNGNVSFDTLRVAGTDEAVYNANIHTNGKLTVKGQAAEIRGFGTYVTGVDVKHPGVFNPYHNATNEPVLQQIDAVDIPSATFDPADMALKMSASGHTVKTTGTTTLSGTYDFASLGATRDKPFVWHVQGDLEALGNTKITGYVMFLVDGDITFNGNVGVGTHEGGAENNYAFYAGDDVEIGGTADALWGQVFAKDEVKFHGTPKIYGNITSGGFADVSGTPKIFYFPASPALTKIWQDPETYLKLVAYSEW